MKIIKEKFICTRDGLKIKGLSFRPEGDNLPVAIVSHGFMANMLTTKGAALSLAKEGYAAFCFDFCGGGIGSKSEGKTEQMSVLTEVEDLKAVIEYARSLSYTNSERLVLMGMSQGGLVSALTAAQLDKEVEKLALYYPAMCIPDDARAGKMMFINFDPQNIPDILAKFPMRIGRKYAEDVIDMDPFALACGYSGPVLIIHGDKDSIVNISYAYRLAEVYGDNAKLVVLPNEGHGFSGNGEVLAIGEVIEFLK